MSEDTIKLLQDRVLEAVARVRGLRAECDALRARIAECEQDDRRIDLEKIRSALRDAIRDLREGDETGGGSGDRAGSRRSG
jgi:hypothetical protein